MVRAEEQDIRQKIAHAENGTIHVPTTSGLIDILTPTEIIELAQVDAWTAGLGRVLALAMHYPDHKKRVHLYGEGLHETLLASFRAMNQYGVRVTTEPKERLVHDNDRQELRFLHDLAAGKVTGSGWDFDGRWIAFPFFRTLYYNWLVGNDMGENSVDDRRLKRCLREVLGKKYFGRYRVCFVRMAGIN